MSTISTRNRTVTVDALVAQFENAGLDVDGLWSALAEVAAEEEREFAERRASDKAILAQYDAEHAQAKATPCEFEGCTRLGHVGGVAPSKWTHVREYPFADGMIIVGVGQNSAEADLVAEGVDASMTAAELRTMADEYESFPGWLRARAAELDTLNA